MPIVILFGTIGSGRDLVLLFMPLIASRMAWGNNYIVIVHYFLLGIMFVFL